MQRSLGMEQRTPVQLPPYLLGRVQQFDRVVLVSSWHCRIIPHQRQSIKQNYPTSETRYKVKEVFAELGIKSTP